MEDIKTTHEIIIETSQNMKLLKDGSIELVVTSPPYPMIEMWDGIFSKQNPVIENTLGNDPQLAFELMHKELDKVWTEVYRVLAPGGIVCINIGDATRTVDGKFALYSNHARILNSFLSLGFYNLPNIIWRKQTNAPNKFMGSGMLPAGAYVTLEHEWILVFRKGGKREFKSVEAKQKRRESSFFWEERNIWFSDIWDDVKGAKQKILNSESRTRSAAFPLEIPYRLINMYSLQGDTILDPFLGTGTTSIAAMMSGRNSIGYEIDNAFLNIITDNVNSISIGLINNIIDNRLEAHKYFIDTRRRTNEVKHFNKNHNIPVVTSQETEIKLTYLTEVSFLDKNAIIVNYSFSRKDNVKDMSIKKMNNELSKAKQTTLSF